MHIEARSGDSSAVAGASILASLSNIHKDLSLLPPPAKAGENVQQNADVSSLPSGHGDNNLDSEMKDSTNNNDPAGVVSAEKTVLASSTTANENPSLESMEVDAGVDAEIGKVTGAAYELRPLLHMLTAPGAEFDLTGSISKMLEERRDLRELLKDVDPPTILASTRRQAYKESLQQGILNPDDIDVSFENFPYFLRCEQFASCNYHFFLLAQFPNIYQYNCVLPLVCSTTYVSYFCSDSASSCCFSDIYFTLW